VEVTVVALDGPFGRVLGGRWRLRLRALLALLLLALLALVVGTLDPVDGVDVTLDGSYWPELVHASALLPC
jgi:hypothetical protein